MRRKITSILAAVALLATMSATLSSLAEAASLPSNQGYCTATVSSGTTYSGSTLVGYAKVVSTNCVKVQARVNFQYVAGGAVNAADGTVAKTSTAVAATNRIVSNCAFGFITDTAIPSWYCGF